ncbi:MAG: FAD-dependent oxidoreductase [Rhodobacteraceae bacterium CG17_big_fil_post_rev_8_21_14_2_50_63_15]|nr:FAD-binding oxidoreductase [Roseovarius sp.]PIV78443.1 MAG: FAD-dependent oxidoreductase [Rhodobacteraceae bacterium CG17_big_fil_post_rev_8_21_14_2_50_63_15]
MTPPLKVIVIGAGICGLSAAIWLRRAGHEVTLLDKDGPGAGASFGNAGLLAQWAIVPVNTPGVLTSGIKYIFNPRAPLFMQWSYFPRLIPWLIKFAGHANEGDTRRMVAGLAPIVGDSLDQHIALTRGTSAAKWIATSDFSYAYESLAKFEADAYGWAIKREAGYIPEVITGGAVQEAEPMLGPAIQCLASLRGHGHILNPGAYMADLAVVFQEEGGAFKQAEVQDISLTEGRITAVATDRGLIPCDVAVLAAGIWSKPLMRKLGLRVPLEAERGHHLHFTGPSQMPRHPLMITSGKFAVTPMAHGLRCAGTVELGGIAKGPSRAPLDLIRRGTARAFPELTYERVEEWVGFRPSTPDSLPLIGEVGRTGVYAAFGHQHIGLTAGPKTGRIVADLIAGIHPNIDLAPYDANRF